ncbi:MAG: hypothetical protein EPO31_02615 [Gammaproteobacteria bacterium]|nr:MAG: hypothetical protein EPO31_02615 [Gammaproteobacteria bacterium]
MAINLPYLTSQSGLKKVLDKVKEASTPDKFNEKYLNEKLNMHGGSAKAIPPFMKRIGFISSDGSPTEWYREFRNPSLSGVVAYKALKHAYKEIYEISEIAHKKSDAEIKGIVAQITGLDHDNPVITYIVATFKTVKSYALFNEAQEIAVLKKIDDQGSKETSTSPHNNEQQGQVGLNIGYNINLNLPATSDIAVFDAIFKSLKEHLLKGQ